jgi:hypothetical protein
MTRHARAPKPAPGAPIHGCTGKSGFTSFDEAQRRAKRMRERTEKPLQPYHCRHCHQYHVGGLQDRANEKRVMDAKRLLKELREKEAESQ